MNTNSPSVMKILECDEENKSSSLTMITNPCFPMKLVIYILSYLPFSSLFRFRCACKLWDTLFLHPHFSFLRRGHSRFGGLLLDDGDIWNMSQMSAKNKDSTYTTISESSQGLLLEQTINASSPNLRYRIHCPMLSRRLAIPNPQNPSLCIALEFVPTNQAVKLVSVHEDEEKGSLGYEILALGLGIDQNSYCWRTVKVSTPNLQKCEWNGKRQRIKVFFRRGVASCIWYVENPMQDDLDIEVDILDMVNEIYIGHTTFPRGFFSKLSNANLLDWKGQLSFSEVVKDELHVLVLDDYRKMRWAERKLIIKLTFWKHDNKEQITFITFACVDKCKLFFVRQDKDKDKKSVCMYDINTGELKTCITSSCIESDYVVTVAVSTALFYKGVG